jgi:hypothetical protein
VFGTLVYNGTDGVRVPALKPVAENEVHGFFKFFEAVLFQKKSLNTKLISFSYLRRTRCCGEKYEWYTFLLQIGIAIYSLQQFKSIHQGHINIAKNQERPLRCGLQIIKKHVSIIEEKEAFCSPQFGAD